MLPMTISEADKYGPDQFKNWTATFELEIIHQMYLIKHFL